MGELDTAFFFLAGFIVLIGVLFLQWLHKLGFKLAKVETSEIPLEASEIPGFSKRFLIQIAAMLVGYGLMYLASILFVEAAEAVPLALISTINTFTLIINNFLSNITGNILIATLFYALIISILYWVELMIAAKLLVSHLTIKTHLVAVIPPVVAVFLVLALPNIYYYFI